MIADVVLPNLGFGMEEGRLIAWLKKEGDSVRKGEPIAQVESDKATVELEAVVDGVLDAILEPAEKVLPVGTVLARIRSGTEPVPPASPSPTSTQTAALLDSQRATPVAQRMASEHNLDLGAVSGTGPGGRITREDVQQAVARRSAPSNGRPGRALAAPAVRKLARENNIDLNTVQGTGEDGHVTRTDIEMLLTRPTPAPQPAPVPAPAVPAQPVPAPVPTAAQADDRKVAVLSPMRQAIARRLVQSAQEAPHFYATAELDLTDALRKLPQGIGINNLLLYLTIQALHDQPALNATFEGGQLYSYSHVHLAMAVALPSGLITPVLHRADDYSLAGLTERARDLIARARENRLRPDELSGGTFTVSNLGIVQQIDHFTAIINPPQVGILAVGAAKERPVVLNGGLHIRTTAHLTLSADHRVIDGLIAARFLEAFDGRLQNFSG